MIIDSQASILITSETRTSADVTRLLGIEPESSWEKGDPQGRPREGVEQRYRKWSGWMISCAEGERGSVNGFDGLSAALAGKEDLLEALRVDYDMRIWWDGLSDSEQPGFYFTIESLQRIAALGCDVMGSAALQMGPEGGPIIDRVSFRAGQDFESFDMEYADVFWRVDPGPDLQSVSLSQSVDDPTRYELAVRWWTDEDGHGTQLITDFLDSLDVVVVSRTRSIELTRRTWNDGRFARDLSR